MHCIFKEVYRARPWEHKTNEMSSPSAIFEVCCGLDVTDIWQLNPRFNMLWHLEVRTLGGRYDWMNWGGLGPTLKSVALQKERGNSERKFYILTVWCPGVFLTLEPQPPQLYEVHLCRGRRHFMTSQTFQAKTHLRFQCSFLFYLIRFVVLLHFYPYFDLLSNYQITVHFHCEPSRPQDEPM